MAQQQQHQQPADDENPDDGVRAQTESSSPPGAWMGGNRQGPLFSPVNSDSHLDNNDGHLGDAKDEDVFGLRHIPQLMGELNQAYIDLGETIQEGFQVLAVAVSRQQLAANSHTGAGPARRMRQGPKMTGNPTC
ncbi:hypothetical protein DXG01_012134 [Tephrocybe rancida]|nr:hypothetical protein DXG01_012134 [Tephrocybe rancida]